MVFIHEWNDVCQNICICLLNKNDEIQLCLVLCYYCERLNECGVKFESIVFQSRPIRVNAIWIYFENCMKEKSDFAFSKRLNRIKNILSFQVYVLCKKNKTMNIHIILRKKLFHRLTPLINCLKPVRLFWFITTLNSRVHILLIDESKSQ